MANELQAIRDYASSLQGEDRQNFINKFNSIKNDPVKISTLASRIGGASQPQQQMQQQTPEQGMGNFVAQHPLVTAGAVGAAGAAYGVGRYINTPNRMLKPINAQLGEIAKQVSPNKISYGDIPQLLSSNYNVAQSNLPKLVDEKTFLAKELNPAVDEIAKHVANNYEPVIKTGYDQYRNALTAIENSFSKSGQQLDAGEIKDLFRVVKDSAIKGGTPEDKLSAIDNIIESYDKNPGDVKFEQVKGNIESLSKSLPDKAKFALMDKWGDFVQQRSPDEAKAIFKDIQSKYAKFSRPKDALFDLINKDSKSFNTSKFSNRLRAFFNGNKDSGVSDLLEFLDKGSDITKPMEGLSERIAKARNLVSQRQISQASQLANKEALDKAFAMSKAKAMDLLSQRNAVIESMPIRSALLRKAPTMLLKGAGMMARGVMPGVALGAVSDELQRRAVGYNPADAMNAWYIMNFGNPQEKQAIQNEYEAKAREALRT